MKFDEYFDLTCVTILVTKTCNLRCSYCYASDYSNCNLTNEQMEIIIDKCYANFRKNHTGKFLVSFFGGEPLCNWGVIKHILDYSNEKGHDIEFGITTNLTLLTDEIIDYFEKFNIGILVSIDGIKEIHDKNRCNSYDIVASNVKRLLGRNLTRLIQARITFTPNDIPHLLDSIKSVYELGIVNIAPVPVTDMEWNDNDYKLFEQELSKVWEWVIEIYNDETNKKNLAVKIVDDYLEKILQSDILDYDIKKTCIAGTNKSCAIGPNGDIMPCHQRVTVKKYYNDLIMGNIFTDDDIREVNFNDGTIKGYYDCDDCIAREICVGGCPSENMTMNDNGNIMNKIQCLTTMIMAKVAIDYQEKILNSTRIRSKKLNILKENLYLYHYFINNVLYNKNNKLEELLLFYEKLEDRSHILLPRFRKWFELSINSLKKELSLIKGSVNG